MSQINTFFNGEFTTVEKASLCIEDRGTLFGDGVYELIRTYIEGKPFQLKEHLQRFSRSAAAIELELPYTAEEITALIEELLAKSRLKQAVIYFQATRGTNSPRTHYFPQVVKPNFFIIARELEPESPEVMKEGYKAILLPDQRWDRCDIKSLNLLPNVLGRDKAVRAGAYDAIFYRDYGITEATSSSVFAVYDGTLHTAPSGNWILPGITRTTVIKLAEQEGIPVTYEFIQKDRFMEADEVMITNSRIDIAPITSIEGRKVGSGKPGPVTIAMKKAFTRFAMEG